jgi:hypothetical protein
MFSIYNNYKKVHFPHLLKDPTVPEEDKRKIAELLKKPWNPYIRRHTAATEISKALKDSVLIDQYMGWSHAGNTRQKYQHYYNDDSFDAMLTMMDGLKPLAPAKGKLILKPRLCPNCQESNTPESRFCSKCKFVLSFDAYNETITDAERAKEEQQRKLQEMEKKLNFMYEALQATKILKDIDNEQKKLLAESPKMQKIAKEIQEEEEQELREDLEEGLKQEQEGK